MDNDYILPLNTSEDRLYAIFVEAEKLKDRLIWYKDSIPEKYHEELYELAYSISELTTYKIG